MELIDQVITELEEGLRLHRKGLGEDVVSGEKIEIEVLGQMSLLMNAEVASKIRLAFTNDVDALLKGKWGGRAKYFAMY